MAENYSFHFKDDSISHHGIEGQQWGVRNGPPYPLGSGQHSRAEVRAAKKENKKVYKETKKRSSGKFPALTELKNKKASEYINEKLRNDPTIQELKTLENQLHNNFQEFVNGSEGRNFRKELAEKEWEKNKDHYEKHSLTKEHIVDTYLNEGDVYSDIFNNEWRQQNEQEKTFMSDYLKQYRLVSDKASKVYEKIAEDLLGEYSDAKIKDIKRTKMNSDGKIITYNPSAKQVLYATIENSYALPYIWHS